MTAPVLSPVRWWRDDATRYVTRGPQIVPAVTQPSVDWAFELLRPSDPGIAWRLEEMRAAIWGPGPLAELFNAPGPGGMSGTGVAIAEYRRRIGLPR